MSDAGLDAELNLDISQALEEINRLQAQLQAATEQLVVRITADTSELPAQVEAAVDGADTTTTVDADTAGVPGEVEAAVDGADSSVDVDADTQGVGGQIEAAVDGADSTVAVDADTAGITGQVENAVDGADTSVTVTADSSGVGELQAEIGRLQSELDGLARSSDQTTSGMQVGFRQVATVLAGVLGASFVRVGADFNTLQQTSRAALTAVLDGAGAATAQMEELTRFTACVDEETQALTEDGWRSRQDLRVGDRILTLNPETCESEWQPIEEIFTYQGTYRMLAMTGEAHDSLTTLNHAWPVRTGTQGRVLFTQSRTLDGDDRLIVAAPHADAPTEAPLSAEIEIATLRRREVAHTGVVWCPSVGNRTWFAQRGGHRYFTGNSSPFPLDEFIRAQQTMIGFGVAADTVVPTLSAIQDAVAATGQSSEAIGEISTILAQVNSTGRFTAEVFNQLGARGVDAAQLIGDQMGLTAIEVRDSVTAGSLDAQEALTALTQGMQAEFEGAADGVKETFDGASDRVRAALRDISSALLETFIDPQGGGAAVDFANDLADALRRLEDVVRSGFGDALGRVGAAGLNSLIAGLEALEPLIISGTQGFIALTPLLEILAGLLAILPPEVLTFVAAWRLLSRVAPAAQAAFTAAATSFARVANTAPAATAALGASQGVMASTAAGARGLATGIGAAATGFLRAAGPMLAITGGLTLLSGIMQDNAEDAREQQQRIQSLAQAMGEADTAVEGFQDGFQGLVESGDGAANALAEAGLSGEALTATFLGAGASLQELGNQLFRLEGFGGLNALLDMADAAESSAEQMAAAAIASGDLSEETGQAIIQADNSFGAWNAYTQALTAHEAEQSAVRDATVDQLQAQGRLTGEQADAVRSTEDLAEAEALLEEALSGGATAAETAAGIWTRFEGITGSTADSNRDFAIALNQVEQSFGLLSGTLGIANGRVVSLESAAGSGSFALREMASSVEGSDAAARAADASLLDLALAIESGAISAEDLEAAAVALDVPLADLEGFAAEAAASVFDFAASVESSLPTISDNLGELDEVTFEGIGDALEDTLTQLEDFDANLGALSPFPALQRLAAEEGPATAAALAGAVEDGSTAVLLEYEAMARGVTAREDGITDRSINEFGPNQAIALGEVGAAAADAFGFGFGGVSTTANNEMIATESLIISRSGTMAAAGRFFGFSGAAGVADGMAPMPFSAGREADASVSAVRGRFGPMQSAGRTIAGGTTSGLESEAIGWSGTTRSAAQAAVDAVSGISGFGPGSAVGSSIGAGIESGLSVWLAPIANLGSTIVAGAISAAESAAGISSPSRVFAEIGSEMGAGLALGILDEQDQVRAAAEELAQAAVIDPPDIPVGEVDPQIAGLAGAQFGPGQGLGSTVINIQPGAIVIQVPPGARPDEARALGRAAERGFTEALAERQIRVDARSA